MSILTDSQIQQLCSGDFGQIPMISPFVPELIRKIDDTKVISFGLTSMGYDVRLDNKEIKIFSNVHATEIDPKHFNLDILVDAKIHRDEDESEYILIPPHSYMLGVTVEYFVMPRDVVAMCLGKSTYARAAVAVNCTPIEPGFEGNVVIECSNNTSLPVRVYLNEGISQFFFFKSDEPVSVSYADGNRKYQGQNSLVPPRV